MRSSALSLVKQRIRANASSTPNAARDRGVLQQRDLHAGQRAAPTRGTPGGARPARITPLKGSPIARAASACPSGTALMPERIASQTNAEV